MGMIQFPKDPFSQEVIAKLEREGLTIKWRYGYKLANRYEVKRVCAGGMGIVWIVEDLFDNRKPYAAKSIKPYFRKPTSDEEWKRREESIQRFLEECKIWVDLEKHRHIVYAEFLEKIEGVPLVMSEFIEGGDLSEWIKKGPLPLETLLDFAIQFCIGMEYANAKGVIVHRDIKPGNIMVSEDRIIKITDFGLVKAIESAEAIREEKIETSPSFDVAQMSISRGMGTPSYMAPEQFSKRLLEYCDYPIIPIGIPTDVFAFGLVLYEMIKGVHPYIEKWDQKLWEKACKMAPNFSRDPRYVNYVYCFLKSSNLNLSIPISDNEVLDELTLKCLKKYPNDRYQSFTGIKEELLRIYRQIEGRDYEIVEEPPQKPNLKNKAKTFWILGREEEALKLYDKALEEDPGDITTWQEKGFALAEAGRLKEFGICMEIIPYLKPSTERVIKKYMDSILSQGELSYRDLRMLHNISLDYPIAHKIRDYLAKRISKKLEDPFKETNPKLSSLLKDLQQGNLEDRISAASGLGALGDKRAVPYLLRVLTDNRWELKIVAAKALYKLNDETGIAVLSKALKNEDYEIRSSAVDALWCAFMQRRASSPNNKVLREENFSIVVSALGEALKDEAQDIRVGAAQALYYLNHNSGIPALIEAINDEDEYVRLWSAVALASLGCKIGASTLIRIFEESSYFRKAEAANWLGFMRIRDAIPALRRTFEDSNEYVGAREEAAIALGKMGERDIILRFSRILKDKSKNLEDRIWALGILGMTGDKSTMPYLVKALKDENMAIRMEAATQLRYLRDKSVIPALIEACKDESMWVRLQAINSIKYLVGDNFTISSLVESSSFGFFSVLEILSWMETVFPKLVAQSNMSDVIETFTEHPISVQIGEVSLGELANKSTIPMLLNMLPSYSHPELIIEALRYILSKPEENKTAKLKVYLKSYSAFEWNRRGLENLKSNKYQEALECFEKAIELDPDWEEPRKNEEKCLKKIGESKSKS